jgi:hypothetical protein
MTKERKHLQCRGEGGILIFKLSLHMHPKLLYTCTVLSRAPSTIMSASRWIFSGIPREALILFGGYFVVSQTVISGFADEFLK